ncbi:hypothetical protein DFQ14_1069 [Halopolyspora algeriensis]|uniref:DUF2267 domain-containing protein n=1 Tax=Halopolyspora algeriensis TaxID=1500506 RepID=A0A368VPV4_9ACTN|nr:DUF2267 domain-containing protein [Halopolyspora algeriensis]RCW43534.1 hypothetical protein DFQ14_1069 [Halopolyspora algeriensis]TQM46403.1 hypothetical protein FHU43_4079 [Halopolyspora algeriensis]
MSDNRAEATRERTVVVGLVADPGLPAEIAQRLSEELPGVLSRRVDNRVEWELRATTEGMVLDAHGRIPIVEMARRKMPDEGWDLMICLTDLPRRNGIRPIIADVSSVHGAALASLPAIGWVRRKAHVRETLVHLIGILAGETLQLDIHHAQRDSHHHIRRRPTERVSSVRQVPAPGERGVDLYLALTGARGRLRLLFGMVRDNRPWRLVPSLSRAFAAAAATAAFGIFYSSIWRMADALSSVRLTVISAFAIGIMVTWLIGYNGLWERPRKAEGRDKAVLYNAATVLTLFFGVAGMYLLLFLVTFLAAVAVISADYLHFRLGHSVGIHDYANLVWLASSMGIVAGALGSSLETEEAVRQATYSKRERERRDRLREREEQEQGRDQAASSG